MDWKALLKSKTVWGIVITVLGLILGGLGKGDIGEKLPGEQESIFGIVDQVIVVVGLITAFIGRVVAKGPLLSTDENK